jgi:hypothetical protein
MAGKFPKTNLERKMRHLADSVAAEGFLTPGVVGTFALRREKGKPSLEQSIVVSSTSNVPVVIRDQRKAAGAFNAEQKDFRQRLN